MKGLRSCKFPRGNKSPNIAVMFPGQGSQRVGMGYDLAARCPAASEVWDAVDDAVGAPIRRIAHSGPADELQATSIAQPAIFAHSMAIFAALRHEIPSNVDFFIGHSVGEYTALCAAGVLDIRTAAHILSIRANAMEAAGGNGIMMALMPCSVSDAEEAVVEAVDTVGGIAEIANVVSIIKLHEYFVLTTWMVARARPHLTQHTRTQAEFINPSCDQWDRGNCETRCATVPCAACVPVAC